MTGDILGTYEVVNFTQISRIFSYKNIVQFLQSILFAWNLMCTNKICKRGKTGCDRENSADASSRLVPVRKYGLDRKPRQHAIV